MIILSACEKTPPLSSLIASLNGHKLLFFQRVQGGGVVIQWSYHLNLYLFASLNCSAFSANNAIASVDEKTRFVFATSLQSRQWPSLATFRARAHWPLCLATGGSVFVAGIFIPVGNHYFQALASTLQFVAQMCDGLWLVPATDRAFLWLRSAASTLAIVRAACGSHSVGQETLLSRETLLSPPHVVLVCSGPPQKRGHLWLNKVASVLGPF